MEQEDPSYSGGLVCEIVRYKVLLFGDLINFFFGGVMNEVRSRKLGTE